jgi:hypothetical protein
LIQFQMKDGTARLVMNDKQKFEKTQKK